MHIKDHPLNANDNVTRNVENAAALEVEFLPITGSKAGELAARFDLVMGFTPEV